MSEIGKKWVRETPDGSNLDGAVADALDFISMWIPEITEELMAEHTPGPWQLEWDGREQRIAKDGIGIARIEPWLGEADGEQAANAYLLNIAPDLLEQRDELLAALEMARTVLSGPRCDKLFSVRLAISKADAAIAKAKEEQLDESHSAER